MQSQEIPDTYGNITQATFLQFVDEYMDVDAAVDQAVGMRKDLRKRIKGAGISLAAFDRARRESGKSEDMREQDDREFRRLMAWLGKPIGTQGDLFEPPPPNDEFEEDGDDEAEYSPDQIYQTESAGRAAGEAGRPRDQNPWGVGSTMHARWDQGWMAGQGHLAERMRPESGNGARRGPGRPPGSRNRPKLHDTGDDAA
jgi:hypothetical protein